MHTATETSEIHFPICSMGCYRIDNHGNRVVMPDLRCFHQEETSMRSEACDLLTHGLSRLSARRSEIVQRVVLGSETDDDVAADLGVSRQAVSKARFAALAELRDFLDLEGVEAVSDLLPVA